MAFFRTPWMQELRSPVCAMLLIRCIKLITKMKEVPYLPYYCEAIIHFHILWESGVLVQDAQGKIGMNLSEKNYHKMIEWYTKTYQALIQVYAQKRDATELLSQFTVREAGVMLPVHPKLREMFLGVYQKHLETGSKLA
jgi:hypothetical protein